MNQLSGYLFIISSLFLKVYKILTFLWLCRKMVSSKEHTHCFLSSESRAKNKTIAETVFLEIL